MEEVNVAVVQPVVAVAETMDISTVVIALLKGVIYRDDNSDHWNALVKLQSSVRDYVQVLGLVLVLDEAEGYRFLRSKPSVDDESIQVPRLISRRPLHST